MTNRSIPRERRLALKEGFENLVEWLNYGDETKHLLLRLLSSEFIRPFFREYRRDYLEAVLSGCSSPTLGATATAGTTMTTTTNTTTTNTTATIEYIDCDELFRLVCEKTAFRQPKYYASGGSNLSKKGWTALDHAARFVVRVLRFSWDHNGEWTHGRFDPDGDENAESDLEFFQVWAVLNYLQAEWQAANLEVWDPESLTRHLQV